MTAYQRPRPGDPAGVDRPPTVPVTVDGHPVTAHAGQTIAAVLLANGRDTWRTTRFHGSPRGTFCGIGACFDCLVTVNGLPDTRACQRTVEPNDAITTQQGAALPTTPGSPQEQAPHTGVPHAGVPHAGVPASRSVAGVVAGGDPAVAVRAADVVVVGGGPAGIAAALAAAKAGVDVLLVDNGRTVGGQFNRQLPVEFAARRPDRLQHGWKSFAAQRDLLAESPRITHLNETSVWAVERIGEPIADTARVGALAEGAGHGPSTVPSQQTADQQTADQQTADQQAADLQAADQQTAASHRLWALRGPADAVGRTPFPIDAKAVVLATGAYDRVLPFPGWDLPGVYTAGAAQALAKGQRISVGRRVLVAGTGPFLLPVAESLVGVGAEVVALLEANSLGTVRKGWSSDPTVAAGKLREAAGYGAVLARHRIPLRHGWTVVAAHGTDHVEAVTIARLDGSWRPVPGTERRIEVDAVCLGFGFTANVELAVATGCELTTAPDGGPAVTVDANQQTTTPGVFAAGELTGVAGAAPSTAEGEAAGAAAAQYALNTTPNGEVAGRGAVGKGRRVAAVLARAYPVRDGWKTWSTAETVVCRCEEVTRGELEDAAVDRGLDDGRAMKLSSRAGLGMCQGRVCSRNVAALLAEPGAVPKPSMKRPIAVPVRLRDLARAQEEQP